MMRIFADSASDLPKQFIEENNVDLFTLRVHLNEREFRDIIEINPTEVYDAMRNGVVPKTSQVSPEEFLNAFDNLLKITRKGFISPFLQIFRVLIIQQL